MAQLGGNGVVKGQKGQKAKEKNDQKWVEMANKGEELACICAIKTEQGPG